MRDYEELSALETVLAKDFSENLLNYLCLLNRKEELENWLSMIGLSYLVEEEEVFTFYKTGKIVVIGDSKVNKNDLEKTAKNLGFDKSRFEYYLDYENIKKESFASLQYGSEYALILVGPMPHMGRAVQDNYSSIITTFEKDDGYPPVKRLGDNTLSISKTSFKKALVEALEEKLIVI